MASVVLRSVGGAVGNSILPGVGGAFLGTLGRSFGGAIDGQLGLGAHVEGPRLQNLSVQDSRYGIGIPIVYGRARVAGNVIWSTDLIETQNNSSFSGGKGGALGGSSVSSTTYSYSVHCAVGICLGAIGGINTIWADSQVIYQSGVWASGIIDGASIYTGTTTQGPDAFMQSLLGSGNVPAYRGLAYIVFENLQLANFGNRLPNLTFEIMPVPASTQPLWLGSVDAGVSEFTQVVQSGGMLPIVLDGSSTEVRTILVGGYVLLSGSIYSGATIAFEVVEYDVTGTTPIEVSRTQSASFVSPIDGPLDCSWSLAPDGRFVVMGLQNSFQPSIDLVIYDTVAQQFGPVFMASSLALGSSGIKQNAWVDAQHIIMDDSSGTHRGAHVFARAGLSLIDLGFFDVWGANSTTTTATLFYAQYRPFAGGLLNYVHDVTVPNVLTIYARPLSWQNNTLVIGAPYTVVSGLTLSVGGQPQVNMLRTGDNEWTFCYATNVAYSLFSFEPGLTSATVTRPWTNFAISMGTYVTNFPLYYGDRLVIVQVNNPTSYCLSEVMLDTGGFSLVLNAAVVANATPATSAFGALRIDSGRLLFIGQVGANADIGQLGIIQRSDTGDSLTAILTDILTRAGYGGGDYDVSPLSGISVDGYVIQEPVTARSAIEPLRVFSPFDLIESASTLRAVPRSADAVVTIPSSEWRAANDKAEPPPALEITRAQELDLPLEVDVDYIDASRDFEVNSQRARRTVTRALSIQKMSLPIVCTSTVAKQIAETRLYTLWAERELVRMRISRRYLAVDPGDVVDLGNGDLLRVTTVNQAGSLMEIQGFYVTAAAQNSAATADTGQTVDHAAIAPVTSAIYLLDVPLLQSTDDQPGVYAAATGLTGWTGASLWRSADGVNYNNVARLPSAATTGIATTLLGNQPGLYLDRLSSVNVQVMQGSLSSCGDSDFYNGANPCLLGSEILQFQNATLIGPGLYTLTNLLRGRRGTEWAVGSHTIGENFVLLQNGAVDFVPGLLTDRGSSYDFRALTKGQSLGDAQDNVFTYGLATIQPFSPANVVGTRASGTGSDLTLVWKRRARLNAEWVDYVDVPLDEPTELYDIEIMNGATVLRTFSSVTSPTVTYTAAQQSSDWGTVPTTFTVNVYQISSRYGRGRVTTVVV